MIINMQKTKEIVFIVPAQENFYPVLVDNIEQVASVKLFGARVLAL